MNFRVASGLDTCAAACLLLAACAGAPDHFYTLTPAPHAQRVGTSAPSIHAILNVTIPSLVDRSEMVINTGPNRVLVLEHERWAAPLADEVAQTLASNIEERRGDVLIGDHGFDRTISTPVRLNVDIVRMSVQRGGEAMIEAHWRILDEPAKEDQIGSETFSAPVSGTDEGALADAYSKVLNSLAARLADGIHH